MILGQLSFALLKWPGTSVSHFVWMSLFRLQVELVVLNAPSLWITVELLVQSDAHGAETTKLRGIALGVAFKSVAMDFVGEPVGGALVRRRELGFALSRCGQCE